MKRKELVRYLMQNGCTLSREGGKYSVFSSPATGKEIPVTRHTEIADFTVKKICKELGLEPPR